LSLISKKIYPEIPPKVEYRLTPQARELEEVLKELAKWAIRRKGAQTPRVAVKRAQFTSNA
jgi:DNA-binding HxlR family transcriptional regulator